MRALFAILLIVFASAAFASEGRLTSDYEIETARRQLAAARTPAARFAPHLNLGDLFSARHEAEPARHHYGEALSLAEEMARSARDRSDFSGYADATAYRGAALAKLGRAGEAWAAFEEALRYAADEARLWNLYASGMRVARLPRKAEAAARNAVFLAAERSERDAKALLDLAVYRYALAGAILEQRPGDAEAGSLLETIVSDLDSPALASVRESARRNEKFEVYSIVRSDADALVSLRTRALLLLARHHESRGELGAARQAWQRVLSFREDDAIALAGLARIASGVAETERLHQAALEANPWSVPLLRNYERYAAGGGTPEPEGSGAAAGLRRALWLLANGRGAEASAVSQALEREHGSRATIHYVRARSAIAIGELEQARSFAEMLGNLPEASILLREIAARRDSIDEASRLLATLESPVVDPDPATLLSLGRLLAAGLPAAELQRADALIFASRVELDEPLDRREGVTLFASGSIDGHPFRFSVPTAFRGELTAGAHRLEYRLAGTSGETLLLEPIGLTGVNP